MRWYTVWMLWMILYAKAQTYDEIVWDFVFLHRTGNHLNTFAFILLNYALPKNELFEFSWWKIRESSFYTLDQYDAQLPLFDCYKETFIYCSFLFLFFVPFSQQVGRCARVGISLASMKQRRPPLVLCFMWPISRVITILNQIYFHSVA